MILGLLPAAGSGLGRLAETGQHTRLIRYYLRAYAAAFEHVHYFSYLAEKLADYCEDAGLRQQVTVWPGPEHVSRALYGLLLPMVQHETISGCNVLRVFQATGALPAIVARAAFGVPYVVTFGYRYADLARQEGRHWAALRLRLMEWMAMRKAAAVIVTTVELAGHVGRHVQPDRVRLIPNGVDTALFAPARSPIVGNPPIIGYVGRLEEEKGVSLLIDAVSGLDVPAQLLLIGDGSQRGLLQEQARARNVPATFLGAVDNDALPTHLQRCSLFALPSPMEGQPKALIEAMACGLPCVASDCPGNRSLIAEGDSGLLFPPRDAGGLRQCIQRICSDSELAARLGAEARRTIVREHDLVTLLGREVTLLKDVAANRSGV